MPFNIVAADVVDAPDAHLDALWWRAAWEMNIDASCACQLMQSIAHGEQDWVCGQETDITAINTITINISNSSSNNNETFMNNQISTAVVWKE